MLEIDRNAFIFKLKDIWWSIEPYDIEGYDRISFHSCEKLINLPGFQREDFSTLIIDLNEPLETIWKKMDKSSCRYAINKSIKDGIKISKNTRYEEFLEMDQSFRKMKGLPMDVVGFDILKRYGTLFIAEYDGELLGGQFYLNDKIHMRWLLGSSRRLEVNKEKATLIGNSNRLITWEAIKSAREMGITEFDLGGYYTGSDPSDPRTAINFFKKSFGGTLKRMYLYRKESILFKIGFGIYSLKFRLH
jgi:hypothetical protein